MVLDACVVQPGKVVGYVLFFDRLYYDILSFLALLWLIIKLSECDILMGLTLSSRCQVLYARKIGTLKAYKDPVFIGWHSRYAIL